jgi:hypothetical protein
MNPGCKRTKKGMLLKHAQQGQAVLYTLDEGVLPAHHVHLYCDGMLICKSLCCYSDKPD